LFCGTLQVIDACRRVADSRLSASVFIDENPIQIDAGPNEIDWIFSPESMSGMSTLQQVASGTRQCAFCGKPIQNHHSHCPHCREAVPKVRLGPAPAVVSKSGQIRRGFLYMLLGLVIHYVAVRSDSFNLPFSVNPTVTYLSTMLFLGGLGLALYGLLTKVRA
jgi:hypothetical protein